GRVVLDGQVVRPGSTTRAVRMGMGLAPEERKAQALLLDHPVAQNITLASLSRYTKPRWLGWLDRRTEFAEAKRLSEALDIRPPDPRRPIRTLSGGNQQKAVLGRWLAEDRKLLLLDELSGCCWCPARCPRCWVWPTGCWSFVRAGSSMRRRPRTWTSIACSTW
ncbi:ATP-binding cassette domain-containing protein, partial [Microbispora bryophytorum]|uniref:ATP-binding cassette domain-containing protein n=1 Tax=Microbispora bryophytorum TaxID=1460882 RepID=UPI0033E9A97E